MVNIKNGFLKPDENLRDLQILEEVSKDSGISQRKLSNSLGVALGVTNACLRKMIRKGYIKVKGINHKRVAYYLTPKGFSEKAKLTYDFLQHTVHYYINLKENITLKLKSISESGINNILFYGAGEVMEVALICINQTDLKLIGIVDDSAEKQKEKMLSLAIDNPDSIKRLGPEAILITSIRYKDIILKKIRSDKALKAFTVYSL